MDTANNNQQPYIYGEQTIAEDIEHMGHETWLGIPKDIWLVIGIDLVLVSLRLRNKVTSNQFVGGKALGTMALITAHFII
tara:strand:- start:1997 stop:2236 length:240 start_codon:yes stop_codon:yes gene_type:complete